MSGDRPAAGGRRAGRPLRVALLGYGLAGEAFHAPLVAAAPGVELRSVVTSSEARAARVRERHPGAEVLQSADEVWRRAGDHDLAVVATPNRLHAPLGLAAIDAGLPVMIDKPLAASVADARRLERAAGAAGVMLAAFQNRRWDGDFLTLRRLLREGALGDVLRFESRFERWRPVVRVDDWRERGEPAEAGGVLFDLGPHLIDQALVLFGPAELAHAEVERRRPGAAADDDAFLALRHESGVISHLWMSQASAEPGPRMRVLGSEAAYVKRGLDVQEAALRAGESPDAPGFGREPPEAWGTIGTEDGRRPVETEPGDYLAFYRGIERALRGEAPPPVHASDAVRGLELIEAALESARP